MSNALLSTGCLATPPGLQEGDPEEWWGENFKSHHDSKPRGPEAISFDVFLPGVRHVYGLPEHATNLSLGATIGELCYVWVCECGWVGGCVWVKVWV